MASIFSGNILLKESLLSQFTFDETQPKNAKALLRGVAISLESTDINRCNRLHLIFICNVMLSHLCTALSFLFHVSGLNLVSNTNKQ